MIIRKLVVEWFPEKLYFSSNNIVRSLKKIIYNIKRDPKYNDKLINQLSACWNSDRNGRWKIFYLRVHTISENSGFYTDNATRTQSEVKFTKNEVWANGIGLGLNIRERISKLFMETSKSFTLKKRHTLKHCLTKLKFFYLLKKMFYL